jgi:small multidrug resistance family-3 protein
MKVKPNLEKQRRNPAQIGREAMSVARSLLLFAQISGAWLVWRGVREHRGIAWIGAGIASLAAYGFVATFQDDPHVGRILADPAAGMTVVVAGSLAWGMALDGFRPDRYDIAGGAVCLLGVAIIMYAPRPA